MIEFGYVFTDENFKILRKDECVVSPGRERRKQVLSQRQKRPEGFGTALRR